MNIVTEPQKNPGRPLGFDPDQALEAAMRVFWLKGYEGASLSDLTGAMGINKPSLYARFGDKRDLFVAALDHYNETIGGSTLQQVIDGQSVKETISAYLSATNDFLTSPDSPPGCMVGSIATDLAGRDEEMRSYVAGLFSSTEAFLAERFKELGDASIDEQTLAELVVSFGQSLAARARVGATLADLNARTERFLGVFFAADEPVPPD